MLSKGVLNSQNWWTSIHFCSEVYMWSMYGWHGLSEFFYSQGTVDRQAFVIYQCLAVPVEWVWEFVLCMYMYMYQNIVWYKTCNKAKHIYNWLLFYGIFCTCHRSKKKNVYTSLLFYCIFCTSFSRIREFYSSSFI